MTIGENNKLIVGVGHPRVIGGVIIKLNMVNSSRKVENDINYIEFPREPVGNTLEDSANYPYRIFQRA